MERDARLRRRGDFARVKREGRSWSDKLLVLVAMPNEVGHTRVGVSASRRIGNAVARNRAKRILRESARQLHRDIVPGWDLLLIARSAITEAKEPEVRTSLSTLLDRARLFLKGSDR